MNEPLSLQTVIAATTEQVFCSLGDEAAILNLKNTVYYGTNAVAASVWKMLQQPRSVEELRNALLDEYDVGEKQCEDDLFALLNRMREEGLIDVVTAKSNSPS